MFSVFISLDTGKAMKQPAILFLRLEAIGGQATFLSLQRTELGAK
jgi:hypothetical protein